MIFWYMNAKICNKPFPNCTNNCFSICIIWSRINFKVDTAIYIFSLLLTSKEWPTSSKPKIIQKPQFLSTLFSNFWYFSIGTYVSNGKWPKFGPSPLWKTFLILDHCVSELFLQTLIFYTYKSSPYFGTFKYGKVFMSYEYLSKTRNWTKLLF